MFWESFWFVGACVIDGFDMNWFTNLKQAWTYLHLSKQSMVCISQTCLKSQSKFQIFIEIVHLTFLNINFSVKSPFLSAIVYFYTKW